MSDVKKKKIEDVVKEKKTDSKPIWLSKTLWVNIIAVAGLFVQNKYGYVLIPEQQLLALAAINAILRAVTKKPVSWNLKGK